MGNQNCSNTGSGCCPDNGGFKEAVCIHTDKIYDSCRDKDCLENLRVYLTAEGQCVVDRAISVKCTKAEVIWVFSDIESVPFNRGYYSVDLKYYFKITLAVYAGLGRPTEVEGLATFDKRVILFGSEGNAKVFASRYKDDAFILHKKLLAFYCVNIGQAIAWHNNSYCLSYISCNSKE